MLPMAQHLYQHACIKLIVNLYIILCNSLLQVCGFIATLLFAMDCTASFVLYIQSFNEYTMRIQQLTDSHWWFSYLCKFSAAARLLERYTCYNLTVNFCLKQSSGCRLCVYEIENTFLHIYQYYTRVNLENAKLYLIVYRLATNYFGQNNNR